MFPSLTLSTEVLFYGVFEILFLEVVLNFFFHLVFSSLKGLWRNGTLKLGKVNKFQNYVVEFDTENQGF